MPAPPVPAPGAPLEVPVVPPLPGAAPPMAGFESPPDPPLAPEPAGAPGSALHARSSTDDTSRTTALEDIEHKAVSGEDMRARGRVTDP